MTKKAYQFFFLLFEVVLCASLLGCGDSTTNSSSSPSTLLPPIDSTPVGETEVTGFWVNVINSTYFHYINKENEWDSDCFVSVDSTNSERITCMVDIPELDLYNNEVQIQYNAAPGMCDHVAVRPAWHWNMSAGFGPKAVTFELRDSAGDLSLENLDPPGSPCNVTLEDNTVVDCSAALELTGYNSAYSPSCSYDYSNEASRPNCCFGSYTYTQYIDTDGDTTPDETITEIRNWGGEIQECLGGSVRTSWNNFTNDGYPVGTVTKVNASGLNSALTLRANSAGVVSPFSYIANHYERVGTPHSHDGYENAAISTRPYSVQPIDDLDGSPMVSGSDAHVVECLDAAGETRHSITVYIREWNTLEDFLVYGTSGGTVANDDVLGEEGVDCEYDAGIGAGAPCNDYIDLDDILTGAGGTYNTDNANPAAAAIRRTFFPEVFY